MAISKKLEEAINRQINREIWSSYLYMSMASYFDSQTLSGFATWMKVQAKEEMTHALRFYNFINARGGRVTMGALEEPETDWKSPLAVFEHTLEHEKIVTGLINDLADLADKENDKASQSMLQWFIDEQVEEEESAQAVIDKIKLMGEAPGGLYMLDQELGQRVFNPPADMVV